MEERKEKGRLNPSLAVDHALALIPVKIALCCPFLAPHQPLIPPSPPASSSALPPSCKSDVACIFGCTPNFGDVDTAAYSAATTCLACKQAGGSGTCAKRQSATPHSSPSPRQLCHPLSTHTPLARHADADCLPDSGGVTAGPTAQEATTPPNDLTRQNAPQPDSCYLACPAPQDPELADAYNVGAIPLSRTACRQPHPPTTPFPCSFPQCLLRSVANGVCLGYGFTDCGCYLRLSEAQLKSMQALTTCFSACSDKLSFPTGSQCGCDAAVEGCAASAGCTAARVCVAQHLGRQDCQSFAKCTPCQSLLFFENAFELLPLLTSCVDCAFDGSSTGLASTQAEEKTTTSRDPTQPATKPDAPATTLQSTTRQGQGDGGGGQGGGDVSTDYEACQEQCATEMGSCNAFSPCRTGLTCATTKWSFKQSCDQGAASAHAEANAMASALLAIF